MQAAAGIVPLACSQCSVSTRAAVIPTIPPQPRLQTRLRPSGQATKQAVTFPRGCAVLQMLPTGCFGLASCRVPVEERKLLVARVPAPFGIHLGASWAAPKINPAQTAGLAGLLGTGWLLSGAAAVCQHHATTATIGATRMHGPTSVSWGLGGFISCRGQREAGFCGVGTARGFAGGTGRALRLPRSAPHVVALRGQQVRREDKCGISDVVNRDRTRSFLAVEPFLLRALRVPRNSCTWRACRSQLRARGALGADVSCQRLGAGRTTLAVFLLERDKYLNRQHRDSTETFCFLMDPFKSLLCTAGPHQSTRCQLEGDRRMLPGFFCCSLSFSFAQQQC